MDRLNWPVAWRRGLGGIRPWAPVAVWLMALALTGPLHAQRSRQHTSMGSVATANSLSEQIMSALDDLNDREKQVVRMRFGLDGGQPRTLEEVGREFGVTRERIRQIESKTLAKLRHPRSREKLEDYLKAD